MLYVTSMIEGCDETSRLIRRTLMRYLTLGSLIVFQATSVRIKKRFPTMDHLIEAGELTLDLNSIPSICESLVIVFMASLSFEI
jgi:hypothetical protein